MSANGTSRCETWVLHRLLDLIYVIIWWSEWYEIICLPTTRTRNRLVRSCMSRGGLFWSWPQFVLVAIEWRGTPILINDYDYDYTSLTKFLVRIQRLACGCMTHRIEIGCRGLVSSIFFFWRNFDTSFRWLGATVGVSNIHTYLMSNLSRLAREDGPVWWRFRRSITERTFVWRIFLSVSTLLNSQIVNNLDFHFIFYCSNLL